MQILMHIDIRHNAPAERIAFQVEQDTIHLIHPPFFIFMLYAESDIRSFPDGTVFIRPAVPDIDRSDLPDIV